MFKCEVCPTEITREKPGAILFSPPAPVKGCAEYTRKIHLCKDCYHSIMGALAVIGNKDMRAPHPVTGSMTLC